MEETESDGRIKERVILELIDESLLPSMIKTFGYKHRLFRKNRWDISYRANSSSSFITVNLRDGANNYIYVLDKNIKVYDKAMYDLLKQLGKHNEFETIEKCWPLREKYDRISWV